MRKMSPKILIPLAIIAVILLLVGNISLWFNRAIFNRQNFANLTTTAIQKPQTRDAIAAEIVDQVFKDVPLLKQVAGNSVESAISGLLNADFMKPVISNSAKVINVILTSNIPQQVAINISSVKDFVDPVIGVLNQKFNLDVKDIKLPSTLVLAEKGQIPSLYGPGRVLLFLGPFAWLLGIGLIVAMVWASDKDRRQSVLKTLGVTLSIGSAILIFLTWMLRLPFLSSITNENLLVIASNIYGVFTGVLVQQTFVLLIIGVLAILAGYYLDSVLRMPSTTKDYFSHRKAA